MHRLTLDEYRKAVSAHPAPSSGQIADFVDYVAGKHSWYKHLPLTPPGYRFILYIDPGAGMHSFESPDGRVEYREIGDGDTLFHYSMMKTSEYRRRFGLLNVVDQGAPGFSLISDAGTAYFDSSPVVFADGQRHEIPAELAFIGGELVTGVIHELSGRDFLWRSYFSREDTRFPEHFDALRWPQETGGDAVLEEIRKLLSTTDDYGRDVDRKIDMLIAPERARQRAILEGRAARLINLLYSADGSFTPIPDAVPH